MLLQFLGKSQFQEHMSPGDARCSGCSMLGLSTRDTASALHSLLICTLFTQLPRHFMFAADLVPTPHSTRSVMWSSVRAIFARQLSICTLLPMLVHQRFDSCPLTNVFHFSLSTFSSYSSPVKASLSASHNFLKMSTNTEMWNAF